MSDAYFQQLNSNIKFIVQKCLDTQNLCKYLYYPSATPLSEPDISDTKILLMNNIYPLPKTPEAILDKKSILNVYFLDGEPYKPNSGFRKIALCFDVMCHLDIWKTSDGLRPISISSEIDKLFNNQHISELSINKIFFERWFNVKYSDYFYGYRIIYRLSQDSNVGGLNE